MNKLNGFSPIYVINLESRLDRKEYIENQLINYGVSEYTIIKAVDGSKDDVSKIVKNYNQITLSNNEIACTLSHLNAIKKWLSESDSDYAIIIEDDLSLETTHFWEKTFNEYIKDIKVEYDILQLCLISDSSKAKFYFHERDLRDFSTAAYLIKRAYAEKLIKIYYDGVQYNIGTNKIGVADSFLYNTDKVYCFPMFTYSIDLGSSINETHVNTVHKYSKEKTLSYWKNKNNTGR